MINLIKAYLYIYILEMNNHFFIVPFSLLILLIAFSSCEQKISHQKAVEYDVSIIKLIRGESQVSNFLDEMSSYDSIAKTNPNKKLEKAQVDTLIIHHQNVLIELDSRIATLNLIKEIDLDINVKVKYLGYLNFMRQMLKIKFFPSQFELLTTDVSKTTPQQEEFIKEYEKMQLQLVPIGYTFTNALDDFTRKYHITRADWKKYGID